MSVPIEAKENQWDISKSKTATQLDEKYQTKVTLSLPSKSEKLESDVVFVLDKSTSAQIENQALEMLKKLRMQIDKTDAKVKVGIVIFNKELLINTIFTNFNVGDKLNQIDIKQKLFDLYTSISYTATPKATDLGNYFEIKKCKITLPDKSRINGIEIIGVKPEYQGTYNNLKIINNQL